MQDRKPEYLGAEKYS